MKRLMSAFSVLESGIVIEAKKREAGSREFEAPPSSGKDRDRAF